MATKEKRGRYWLLIEPEIMRLVDEQAARETLETRQPILRRAVLRELGLLPCVPRHGEVRDEGTADATCAA